MEKLLREGTSDPEGKTTIVQLHREKKKDKIPVPWEKNYLKKLLFIQKLSKKPNSPGRVFQPHWCPLGEVCFGLLLENIKDLGKVPWHR